LTKEPKQFFVWLWEVFYGEEDYVLNNFEEYKVNDDLELLYQIIPNRRIKVD
jgi:hypothetical protein